MLGKKVIYLFLLIFSFQSLSAQDEIYTHDGKVLQVVLLELKDDVLFYKKVDDQSNAVHEINLTTIKDFKLFVNNDSESQVDPVVLLERFKLVNRQGEIVESPRVDDEETGERQVVISKNTSTDKALDVDNSDVGKSVLEQNYLSWEWEERAKDVEVIKEKLAANKSEIEDLRSKKRAIQINLISLYQKAINVKYKQRAKSKLFIEGSAYGFNVSNPGKGGAGFSVDAGLRYMFLDNFVDNYYRKNLGLGIAGIVGYSNANSYRLNENNKVWNRSVFYVGPDLNCHSQFFKNWYIDCAVGVFALIGKHELTENNVLGVPIDTEIVESYNDGTVRASSKYGSRFEMSLGYSF